MPLDTDESARRPAGITVPTYDEILRLPRELDGVEAPLDFQDENGHMNIRHYFDLGARAISTVFERIGITDDYRNGRHQGFFTAEHHIRYFSEVTVGEVVSVHFALLERSAKVLHGMSVVINDTHRQVASTLEFVATHVDLRTRRVTVFDDDIAAAVDEELALVADVVWNPPVCGSMGIRRR